jgi:hypothetical protein
MFAKSLIKLGFHPPTMRTPVPFPYHVKNEEVLLRVKKKRSTLQTIKRKANWIGHISCRNCLRKHVIERKIEGRGDWKKRKLTYAATG